MNSLSYKYIYYFRTQKKIICENWRGLQDFQVARIASVPCAGTVEKSVGTADPLFQASSYEFPFPTVLGTVGSVDGMTESYPWLVLGH